jgi:hypothetical protein
MVDGDVLGVREARPPRLAARISDPHRAGRAEPAGWSTCSRLRTTTTRSGSRLWSSNPRKKGGGCEARGQKTCNPPQEAKRPLEPRAVRGRGSTQVLPLLYTIQTSVSVLVARSITAFAGWAGCLGSRLSPPAFSKVLVVQPSEGGGARGQRSPARRRGIARSRLARIPAPRLGPSRSVDSGGLLLIPFSPS